jgi:hypothetical protein
LEGPKLHSEKASLQQAVLMLTFVSGIVKCRSIILLDNYVDIGIVPDPNGMTM